MKSFFRMVLIVTLVVTIGGFGATFYIYYNQDKFDLPFVDSANFKKEFESVNGKSIKGTNYTYSNIDIDDSNHYRYKTYDQVLELLNSGTGIIFFGHKYSPRSRSMVNVLDAVVEASNLDDIYYLDIHNDDEEYETVNGILEVKIKGSKEYYELLNILKDFLPLYKNEYPRITYPTVVFVKKGNIVGVHSGTVSEHTNQYYSLTTSQEEKLKSIYMDYIDKIK